MALLLISSTATEEHRLETEGIRAVRHLGPYHSNLTTKATYSVCTSLGTS